MNVVEFGAPSLDELSNEATKSFLDKWNLYEKSANDKNAGLPANSTRRYVAVSMISRVKKSVKQFICQLKLEIDEADLTDEILKKFLKSKVKNM